MSTFGYRFRPWTDEKVMADGPSILKYIRETAADAGIDKKIRFGHRMSRAEWSSAEERWTVWAERDGSTGQVKFTARFLFVCSGYYKYDRGHTPPFLGIDDFAGRVRRRRAESLSVIPPPARSRTGIEGARRRHVRAPRRWSTRSTGRRTSTTRGRRSS